jgi:hypothetical protein
LLTDTVLICDEFIVVVKDVDQEQELLMILKWQWLYFLFEVV